MQNSAGETFSVVNVSKFVQRREQTVQRLDKAEGRGAVNELIATEI